MNLPDDARPVVILSSQLVVAGTSSVVTPADLFQVITCITGGAISSTNGQFTLTLTDPTIGSPVVIYAESVGGTTIFFQIGTFAPPWIPIAPGSLLQADFNSTDAAATAGFLLGGWQYNAQG